MIEPYVGTEPFIGFIPDFVAKFINACLSGALDMFSRLLNASGMTQFYISMVFVFLVGRFFLAPIFGGFLWSSSSDVVKRARENSRYKGSFEKNQKGKYSK